jgi:mannitol 2-dehydrogenase
VPSCPVPLNPANLRSLSEFVSTPRYDRDQLVPSVVHFGVGSFHRAHQAAYLDELAQSEISREWGITGVGCRRPNMRDALAPQAGLYTLLERGSNSDRARIVGALTRCLYAGEDLPAIAAALADPRTKLVTLTITADGYRGRCGPHADPFALLAAGLESRRRVGARPFTVLSCDNVPENGRAARAATLKAAARRSPGLADWIDSNVAFPGSVVDRITPEPTSETRALVARKFGIDDRRPVVSEPYSQWIIEDEFSDRRPPLDGVGARFVADLAGFQAAKKRLLNGGHCAIGYLGTLLGHETTDAAMRDPVAAGFISHLLRDEIVPLLEPTDGFELTEYAATILERLGNPKLGDQLSRLCRRGSTKVPDYLLPSFHQAVQEDAQCSLLALSVAAWMRYLRGTDMYGRTIQIHDQRLEHLRALALEGGDDPRPLLSEASIFGDLGESDVAIDALGAALTAIERDGVRRTVQRYLVDERILLPA